MIPFLFAIITLISLLVLDTSISNVSDSVNVTRLTPLFIFIIISFIISQYFVLSYISCRNQNSKRLNLAVTIVQSILIGSLILLLFDIITGSYYNTTFLLYTGTVSYILGVSVMGFLSYKFFSWYKRNRAGGGSLVLSYGIATAITTMAILFTIIFYDTLLMGKPALTTPATSIIFPQVDSESTTGNLKTIYNLFSVLSFLSLWISTGILLGGNSEKVGGKSRFWAIMSIPLIYFLSQYVILLSPNNIFLITLYSLEGLVVGGLFGLPFLVMAAKNQGLVREYLSIAGFGFILVFVSGTATVAQTPYPPFGLASVFCVGLSSYLVFAGLYNSAVAISYDSRLRTSIRKLAIEKSELLDDIGIAQMEQEIEKTVLGIRKEQNETLKLETERDPEVSENDLKQYLEQAMEEVKRIKEDKQE